MKYLFYLFFPLLIFNTACAQTKKYDIRTVAFYNLENMFDTINDPKTFDDSRTPTGRDHYTSKIYWEKVNHMAKVISLIGKDKTNTSPTLMGVAEIENKNILVDIINTSYLKDKNYGIIHYDSPDRRGIDVALLYQKKYFKPSQTSIFPLKIYENGKRHYTRDQLLVSGLLDDEMISIIVNHWPSRYGGEARSRPNREAAARLNKKIIDSLQQLNPKIKLITMGDLNDDPINISVAKILKAKGSKKATKEEDIYNPMLDLYRRGLGTLAYHDKWNLFDQIMVTGTFLAHNQKNPYRKYTFYKAHIFNKAFLKNKKGRYKGYPFRSYVGSNYNGGYSDHFPVYAYFIKEMKTN